MSPQFEPVPTDIEFKLSDDGIHVAAEIHPAHTSPPISEQWFYQQLNASEYAEIKVDADAIAQWVTQYAEGNTPTSTTVGKLCDGLCEIKINEDAQTAYISTHPPHGGRPLTRADIFKTLVAKGITRGVDNRAISQVCSQPQVTNIIIAQGTPAKHGKDSGFEKIRGDIRDRKPSIDENGRVNYQEAGNVITVKPGDPLIRQIPPTAGTNGINIFGKVELAQDGELIPYSTQLTGVRFDSEDPTLLLADIHGQAVLVEQGAIVEPTITVDDVDLHTGNIDFDGTITINGNVTTGMAVKSTGDVIIHGMVEAAATIESDGDVIIGNGVIGRGSISEDEGQPGKGIVRIQSKCNVQAKFIENAVVRAGQQILVDELLAHSDVFAKDKVIVGNEKSKRGHIRGGVIYAENAIQAQVLGSPAGVVTRLEVGDTTEYQKQLTLLSQQLDAKRLEQRQVEKRFGQLVGSGGASKTPKNKEIIKQLNVIMSNVAKEVGKLSAEHLKIKTEIERLHKAVIVCSSNAHLSIEIKIANATEKLLDEKRGGKFLFKENRILFISG